MWLSFLYVAAFTSFQHVFADIDDDTLRGMRAVSELADAFQSDRLMQIADERRAAYASARPFPHTYIDDMIPISVLRAINDEHPEAFTDDGCQPGMQYCFDDKVVHVRKGLINNSTWLGPMTKTLVSMLKTRTFLRFLERLSGIDGLLADWGNVGSGIHFVAPGGSLKVHADFNLHPYLKVSRRLNIFVYLNPDWLDSYGGHLEMWSRDMRQCLQRIAPSFGRVVVFSSSAFSHHGHPNPLTAPPGRVRRSIAQYYYTGQHRQPEEDCMAGECWTPQDTMFYSPIGCKRCEDEPCRRYNASH